MYGDIFGCHGLEGDATSIEWAEARDAAERSTVHRTDTELFSPNISSAEVEKPCSKLRTTAGWTKFCFCPAQGEFYHGTR